MSFDDNQTDDLSRPAEKWDPLTAPVWDISDEDDLAIAPPVEKFLHQSPETARNIPQPADVDQILRGEYTGWVPIIKPGDTLQDATHRFEIDNQKRAAAEELVNKISDEIVEPVVETSANEVKLTIPTQGMAEEDVNEIHDLIADIKAEPEVYVKDFYPSFRNIAQNPDTVVSPSQALDEARRRIEQMRANLQVNLSRVAQSFDHPIFEPEKIEVQEIPESITKPEPIVVEEVKLAENVHIPMPTGEAKVEATPVEEVFTESVTTEPEREVYEEPVRQQVTTSVLQEEKPREDHSLELVIMRDEIKDLRDRLDASQKMIENLMERLANLAELALKRNN